MSRKRPQSPTRLEFEISTSPNTTNKRAPRPRQEQTWPCVPRPPLHPVRARQRPFVRRRPRDCGRRTYKMRMVAPRRGRQGGRAQSCTKPARAPRRVWEGRCRRAYDPRPRRRQALVVEIGVEALATGYPNQVGWGFCAGYCTGQRRRRWAKARFCICWRFAPKRYCRRRPTMAT